MSAQPAERRMRTLDTLRREFPQLARLVPPLPARSMPYKQAYAELLRSDSEAWCRSQIEALDRTSAIHPAADTAGLIGLTGGGDCLGDLWPQGATMWFDPSIAADDRDFVLLFVPETSRYAAESRTGLIVKQLRHIGGYLLALHIKAAVPIEQMVVLGVLRRVDDPPATVRLRYSVSQVTLTRTGSNNNLLSNGNPQADTDGLLPGAATQVESVEDDSVSLINGGGVVLSKSLSAIGISYLLQVTATFDVWKSSVGGTPEFSIDVNGNSTQLGVSQSFFPNATASPGNRVTLQSEVPIDPSDEVSLQAAVVWTGSQPSGTAEVRNAALRCEKIKR